jgi:hypothetical protein
MGLPGLGIASSVSLKAKKGDFHLFRIEAKHQKSVAKRTQNEANQAKQNEKCEAK